MIKILLPILILVGIGFMARPSTMAITQHSGQPGYFPPWGYVVEQQSQWLDWNNPHPVINPRPGDVYWGIDDIERWSANGKLSSGQSYSISKPVILDNYGHLYKIAASNGQNRAVRLTISIPEVGFSYSRDFINEGQFCLSGPWYNLSDSQLTPIENSNGGVGIPATIIWTVTSTDSKGLSRLAFNAGALYPTNYVMDAECGGTARTALQYSPKYELVGQ